MLQRLLVAHAEAVFFIDDDETELLELQLFAEQLVGADEDVDAAVSGGIQRGFLLFGGLEARQHFDAHRPVGEAVAEVFVVLLGEQGGRHQHGDLLAILHSDEGGAHGNLGLAEADIAAD